jgi:hypothetical protein
MNFDNIREAWNGFTKAMSQVFDVFRKFQSAVIESTPHIQRQNAQIDAQRARARYLEYRKVKSQRRNWGHWRP